jgi:hypothetical protein
MQQTTANSVPSKTKGFKNRFLLYNILLDIFVFLLIFATTITAIMSTINAWIFYILHAAFILTQVFWLKKLSLYKSIIYAVLLLALAYITYNFPYIMLLIGFIFEK